jgi:hypothetical protein
MSATFVQWRAKHFVPVSDYSWRPKDAQTEKKIRDELARHAVSINLADAVSGIPEPLPSEFLFSWDRAQFDRITRFTATHEIQLPDGGVRVADSAGSYLAMLRQLTSGLIYRGDGDPHAYLLSSARMDALEQLIDGVQGPVLVAVFFRAEVEALLQRFGARAKAFVGSTTPKQRAQLITDWNADRIPILLAAPSAMGHGINLQHGSCRTLVWFTHSFDWAQRAQFNARLVRSGQTKTISLVDLVGDAGLDRTLLNVLSAKQSGEQAVLEALDIRHRFVIREVADVAL